MRDAAGIVLFTVALLSAAPAAAQQYWHCMVREELAGGIRATLTQAYLDPDRPMAQPVHEVSASSGGLFFSASSYPHWRSLDLPFAPPRRIILGVRLPERAASRAFSFQAPGVRPFTLRGQLYGPRASEIGASFEIDDLARITALLNHPDWTIITRHPDGRVQQIVTLRMPVTLETLRALRVAQVVRMRAFGRDPNRYCALTDDAAIIVN
jgi:hypothetical protein